MSAAPVSVIMPTHDRPEQVEQAVRSALAQDPAPLEVIVCDDASGDETVRVLADLAAEDARVRVVRTDAPSGGPGAPRNLGLAAARAPWVAFLDDDDLWLPGKLAAQLAVTEDADLVATNAIRRTSGAPYFAATPDATLLAVDNILITSTVMVRTELLRAAGGFPPARRWAGIEDYGAWLELGDRGARIRILNDCLVDYRDGGEDRLSEVEVRRIHRGLAQLHGLRWLRRPLDPRRARTAASAAVTWVRG